MTFTRFVEAGRVALVNYGPDLNKLVVIVDIVDQNRVLVENPGTVKRQIINVKRIALTSIKIDGVERGAKSDDVKAKFEAEDVLGKFAASSWGRKIARKEKRANLNDFDRFKVMVAQMKKSKKIAAEVEKLVA